MECGTTLASAIRKVLGTMIKRLIAYRAVFAMLVATQPTIRLQELAEEGRVLAQQIFVNRVLLGLGRFTDIQADNLGSKLGVRLLQDARWLLLW